MSTSTVETAKVFNADTGRSYPFYTDTSTECDCGDPTDGTSDSNPFSFYDERLDRFGESVEVLSDATTSEIVAFHADGSRQVLEAGPPDGLTDSSLRLTGRTVAWVAGGMTRSATFPRLKVTSTELPVVTRALQIARSGAVAATLADGQVLVAGGADDSDDDLQSAELFDPSTDMFTALPPSGVTELQTPRQGAVAVTLPSGKVLIAGGDDGAGALSSAELFDPATKTFTALPAGGDTELQTARYGAVAAVLPDGQVLIAGGANTVGALSSAELFDPSTDTFTALPASGNTEL